MSNWTIIVSVALGILLYKVLKVGLSIVCFLVTCGVAIALLTHLGIIPPFDSILRELSALVGLIMN